jgi:NDP-sugar pyrophosphorylase family protein
MLCRDYFDQATSAFNALLSKQSTEYTEYKNWFGVKEPDKYEKARRILLKTRRSKITKYDEFSHCLEKIKQES